MPVIREHQRPGDPQPHRARLAGEPTANDARLHVERAERVGGRERLLNVRHERGPGEIVAQRPPVDAPLARSGRQIDARDAELAASDRMPAQLRCDAAAHLDSPPPPRARRGAGAAAAGGGPAPAYPCRFGSWLWGDMAVSG